jgi:hypothetical protein
MLVAIDDHSELRAPIAQMVVADYLVPEESQRAVQSIADDGRTNVAHMHGLSHVGGRVVDDNRPGRGDGRDAQPRVRDGFFEPRDKPIVATSRDGCLSLLASDMAQLA